jgi:crossover junction endodeoxyribonuclease RuvC
VKSSVTGDGRADKSQMQFMVQKLLRLDAPPKPVDAADALGLALTHLAAQRLKKLAAGA